MLKRTILQNEFLKVVEKHFKISFYVQALHQVKNVGKNSDKSHF